MYLPLCASTGSPGLVKEWLLICEIKFTGRLFGLDPAFFEVTQTGEVLSRLTTDTTLVQSIAGVGISIALRGAITLIGALIMLGITSPKLMGYILVLVPLVVVPIIVIGRKVRRLSRDSQDRVADSSGMAGETLNAVQTIQAFTLEKIQSDRFSGYVEEAFATAARRIRVRSAMTGLTIVALFGSINSGAVDWHSISTHR